MGNTVVKFGSKKYQIIASVTLGSTSNTGPIHSNTIKINTAEKTEAICVLPPVCSWIKERDSEVPFGTQENSPPIMLLKPWK